MSTPFASNHFAWALLAACAVALAASCAPQHSGGVPAGRGWRAPAPTSAPEVQRPAPPEEPPTPRWRDGRREFRDRNRDGLIDLEVLDLDGALGTDGYGRWKMDEDFDGFYDVETERGGIAGETRWTQKIHEPVPKLVRR